MTAARVAAIGAHPDDELLGAGGTLARHVKAGDQVHAVVVADGAASRYPAELTAVLEKQARQAAEVIGFASLRLLALPDQRLDTVPLIELTQQLEAVLDDIDPSIVYTHFPEDVNADHGAVAEPRRFAGAGEGGDGKEDTAILSAHRARRRGICGGAALAGLARRGGRQPRRPRGKAAQPHNLTVACATAFAAMTRSASRTRSSGVGHSR